MAPLGWTWEAVVWGFAFSEFLIIDQVKLLTYR